MGERVCGTVQSVGCSRWLQALLDVNDATWPVWMLPGRLILDLQGSSAELGNVLHVCLEGILKMTCYGGTFNGPYHLAVVIRMLFRELPGIPQENADDTLLVGGNF